MIADVSSLIGELSAMSEADVSPIPVDYVLGRLRAALVDDVSPVVHGHLEIIGFDSWYCKCGTCSVCGVENFAFARYCAGCGAKMDAAELERRIK